MLSKVTFNNQRGEDRTENFVHINTCILIIPITTHISPGLTKCWEQVEEVGGGGEGVCEVAKVSLTVSLPD